jgi:hypothetical protein
MKIMFVCTMAVLTAVALGGCGSAAQNADTSEVSARSPIMVRVTNLHHQDVVVYATDGGQRVRLGMVITGKTELFTAPSTFIYGTGLQVQVHPIGGGGDYLSDRVMASPGEEVVLNVAPVIDQTYYSVYSSRTAAAFGSHK